MSLRLRLALWYAGLAGLLILFVCTYSYAVHGRAHYDGADAVLASSAEHVASELSEARTSAERVGVLHAALLFGSAMQIYDADGVLRLSSSTVAVPPVIDLPRVRAASTPAYPWILRYAPSVHASMHHAGTFGIVESGERWRLYALAIAGTGESLVAMTPLAVIDASVRRFGMLMGLMAFLGAVVTFFAAWVVAASVLRPIAEMTNTAGAIARSGEVSRRVSPESANSRDELGRLASTFNEMLASLEKAYAAQQRFVSDASHELRAPLTSIQANLELLRDRKGMPADEREHAIAEAASESSRLARLCADLLALARADAGTTLRREDVELDRVLMDVVGDARHLLRGQHLEIDGVEPSVIRGDQDRIKQLLFILLDNAVTYTPAPGRISVSLRRGQGVAVFTVHDSGIGIPEADLPRVFERFYRADRARSREPGGTGLGLSIAQWIVTEHGGRVELTSAPGRGTTATAILPLGD